MSDEDYKIYKCIICGWEYNEKEGSLEHGIKEGTRWEELPDDWVCPECGVGKSDFEKLV